MKRAQPRLFAGGTLLVVFFVVALSVASRAPQQKIISNESTSWISQAGAGLVGPACASSTNLPEIEAGNCTYTPSQGVNRFNQIVGDWADGGSDVGVTINQGQSTNLCWSCGYGTNSGYSATGNNFSTGGAEGGQTQVSPSVTTNYSITCLKVPYKSSNTVTVTVIPAPSCTSSPNICGMTNQGQIINGACNATTPPDSGCPPPATCGTSLSGSSCGFVASPTSALLGQTITLQWYCPSGTYSSSQGDTHFSTGGALSGSVAVNPTQSTTYNVTCTSSSGNSIGTANVTVNQPNLSLTSNPTTRVQAGQPLTISWSATNVTAGSCAVTSNTAPTRWTGESGSQQTSINAQTTFTLTCSEPAGPVSTSLTLQLSPQFQEQ